MAMASSTLASGSLNLRGCRGPRANQPQRSSAPVAVAAARRRRAGPAVHVRASKSEVFIKDAAVHKQKQQELQQQQDAPFWRVLNPFGRQKQQATLATVSEAELWQMLEAEQEVPLVVIFSAPWCGPCKIMVQRLEAIMRDLGAGGVRAVKVDTDESPGLATALKVYKLPTLFFVGPTQRKPAAQFTGLLPESVLRDMVTNKSQFLGTDIRQAINW